MGYLDWQSGKLTNDDVWDLMHTKGIPMNPDHSTLTEEQKEHFSKNHGIEAMKKNKDLPADHEDVLKQKISKRDWAKKHDIKPQWDKRLFSDFPELKQEL